MYMAVFHEVVQHTMEVTYLKMPRLKSKHAEDQKYVRISEQNQE